jgi:hypothetical protein
LGLLDWGLPRPELPGDNGDEGDALLPNNLLEWVHDSQAGFREADEKGEGQGGERERRRERERERERDRETERERVDTRIGIARGEGEGGWDEGTDYLGLEGPPNRILGFTVFDDLLART